MSLDVATGNVTEGTPKAYDASMEASAIDAGTVYLHMWRSMQPSHKLAM